MIRCVLLDLDGTLIDTWDLYVRAMERTLKEICSEEIPADRLATLRLNSEPRLLGYFVPQDEVGSAHQRFLANYHTLHETCFGGVYPGVTELLTSLRNRGIKTGIVSGKSRGAWEITRSYAGLGDFDNLVFDDDVSAPKPDCEGLVKAMKNLGVSPSETIYVGDSKDDLEAATTAGIRFLAAEWSKTEAEISSFDKAAAKIGPYDRVDYPGEIDQFLEDLQKDSMPEGNRPVYNYNFDRDDIESALACMDEYGFCVILKMIDQDMVTALKDSIDRHLDPEGDLGPASNRYHMSFAEDSQPVWDLVDNPAYMRFIRTVHGSTDICLHRSAAILRTPGEGMGRWHQDHRGHIENPQHANDVLNRFPIPSGAWFYLNGSHPDRSGIAVIEKSHYPEWDGPAGYVMGPNRSGLYPEGGTPDTPYDAMAVPGCVPVLADPGDLICFAALTWHVNMATHERRYSCGIGFRPKSWRIDAPWSLPDSAASLAERLPYHLKHFTDGYTGFDGEWKAE